MNKEQFYVGQKVFCIDNDGRDFLKIHEVYTISNVTDNRVKIKEFDDEKRQFYPERFIDAEKFLHNKEFTDKLDKIIESD